MSALGKEVHSVVDKWDECNEGYVIKYKSQIKDFEYYTFYDSIDEYLKDSKNGWIQLKNCCYHGLLIVVSLILNQKYLRI